jgi:Ca2+-binding RTX toxin-like protein
MNTRLLSRLAIFALAILVLTSILSAAAAANFVPVSLADDQNLAGPSANLIKPPECTMNLTNIVNCPASGTCTGTGANDLFLDTSAGHTIRGGAGDDCIMGGGGNDTINGQGGNDVIFGGDGDDSLNGGAGTDVCIGGPGNDTFNNCETQIQ